MNTTIGTVLIVVAFIALLLVIYALYRLSVPHERKMYLAEALSFAESFNRAYSYKDTFRIVVYWEEYTGGETIKTTRTEIKYAEYFGKEGNTPGREISREQVPYEYSTPGTRTNYKASFSVEKDGTLKGGAISLPYREWSGNKAVVRDFIRSICEPNPS